MSEEINKVEVMNSPADARWYVVHTYSGYEQKVRDNIAKTVENRGMEHLIQEISVPLQDVEETKNGKTTMVQRKVFPGYVLIHMIMNDETWYIVRNTRGVTSFVGPGSKPVPLTDIEVRNMGIGVTAEVLDLEVGDAVRVVSGPFADSVGHVKEINEHKKSVVVSLSIFGRETPTGLDFAQVEKV